MASEYWLCVQIPALPCPAQTEKDQWHFFTGPSNFFRRYGTNRVRTPTMLGITANEELDVGMKIKTLGIPLAVAALLALSGCSTQTVVTLQNGTQYLTKDMPKTKTDDGFYEFEDISGAKVKVRADEVATVRKED
ncbi:uncharacterized protein DUF903 [Pseudomonas baetica]|uniref:Uncharacterized protein DUF903 n=2 Tax=Pseudomonas baetica TaxID=674054 RepID=A0ABX4PY18_9PSED|nr:uncharacterized protein DUF903 [Pseudomonas baetica]